MCAVLTRISGIHWGKDRQISWLTCSLCVSDEGQIDLAQVETVLAVNELSAQVWSTVSAGLSLMTGNFDGLYTVFLFMRQMFLSTSKAGKKYTYTYQFTLKENATLKHLHIHSTVSCVHD